MPNIVRYNGDTARGPSPAIWGDLGKWQADNNRGHSILLFNDFVDAPVMASATNQGGFYTYQDTSCTVQPPAEVPDLGSAANKAELGTLAIAQDGTDNDECHVQLASSTAQLFRIGNGSGNTAKVAFEARVRVNTIADTISTFFVGMGTGAVADGYIVDAGTLITTKGFIGFQRFEDDGDKMDSIYQAATQTQQSVEANVATLVADTYIKLGFLYDPTQVDPDKKLKFFVDGVEAACTVSTTNIDAATFPEDEALIPMILSKAAAGTASTITADWVCAGSYVDSTE